MRRQSLDNFETDVLLCGEQLRNFVHQHNLVRNRMHYGKGHINCFVACELVDKLVNTREVPGRRAAIIPIQILLNQEIIHSVNDESEFKDEYCLYAFRLDDNTFVMTEEAEIVLETIQLYNRISVAKDVITDHVVANHLYPASFSGKALTDWLVEHDDSISDREAALIRCQALLEWKLFGNVLEPYQNVFTDDAAAIYQFRLDLRRKRSLTGLLVCTSRRISMGSASSGISMGQMEKRKISISSNVSTNDTGCYGVSPGGMTDTDLNTDEHLSSTLDSGFHRTPPVVLRCVSAEEIEDHDSPFVKRRVVLIRDAVGYGFVIRGSGPCYVQVIDPNSPAANSALKVRQYLGVVNDINVLRQDSKDINRLISESEWLNMVVYMHFRDASMENQESLATTDS